MSSSPRKNWTSKTGEFLFLYFKVCCIIYLVLKGQKVHTLIQCVWCSHPTVTLIIDLPSGIICNRFVHIRHLHQLKTRSTPVPNINSEECFRARSLFLVHLSFSLPRTLFTHTRSWWTKSFAHLLWLVRNFEGQLSLSLRVWYWD